MLRPIGGNVVADANVTATTKVQKKIICDFITGDGRKKAEGWLLRYMEFPSRPIRKLAAGGSRKTRPASNRSFPEIRRQSGAAHSPKREGRERLRGGEAPQVFIRYYFAVIGPSNGESPIVGIVAIPDINAHI